MKIFLEKASSVLYQNRDKFVFPIFFIFTFFQYGLVNISRLGLISDDWDTFRAVFLLNSKSVSDAFDFFLWQSGPYLIQRPFWLTIMPLQIGFFQGNIALYFIVNVFIFSLACWFFYNFFTAVLGSKEVAFFAILLFICAPFHTASLYWISAQMSLFSLLFISIAMYFSIKYSIFYSTFLSYLFAFISILVYENSIALMPLIVLVILFSKESFYKKVIYVLPYPLGLFSYLLFKRTALVFINATEFVKEASLIRSDSLKLMLEQITLFSNFFFGPDALKFVSDILRNYRDLIVLEYFSSVLLLLVAFLYLLYTLYVYVRKKYHSSKYLCDVPPISRWILYFSFILSFFVPVIGNYSTSSAPMGDRINLPHLLLLATLGSAIILDKARVLGLKVIFLFLLFFTIMNNISLAHYIRASELQLEFAEFIKHTEISENTLINLSTDIRTYKGIPVLDNIWTRTYIISNYKNLYNVETDIDYDRFSTDGSTIKYQSILSPTRFFSDPAIIDITYFRNQ